MEHYTAKYFSKKYDRLYPKKISLDIDTNTIGLIIPRGRQNKFPFSDAEYSANAATIMAVCVCEMLSDIGYFCLKVKTVVKKIGYF